MGVSAFQTHNISPAGFSSFTVFNDMLHDYRVEILPTVVENWENMDDAEKEHLMRMNNFFVACIMLWVWQNVLMKA